MNGGIAMKFQIPSSYELQFEEKLHDLNGHGLVLVHKKTGARVAIVSTDDVNKVFYIGFRTPPANSTGVAHIIEHSVLCGSQNFPAKDPFVELAKGSLNTFLNAMTYPDKTVYPIASVNDQDFKNLMHVYMDAVLYPNIYNREEIFWQEGWHYDLENEDGELKYNGVVYNEMKGAFSSPESMLFRLNKSSMFPDTPYGFESGGDPDFIPDLSYEEFLDFHRTYYHPSNSYIYLYGDMDFEERLNWLDHEYLSKFDRLDVKSEIGLQKPFNTTKEITAYYPLGEGEGIADNTYLSYNTVIGDALDKSLSLTFQILEYVLLAAPGAPIKQALLDGGIGKDIFSSFEDEIRQSCFSIIAKNSEESKKEQFVSIIKGELRKLVENGLNENSLRAAINFFEFRYREADYGRYPKGLMYGLRIMGSWLHDENKTFMHLKDNEGFEFLKEQIGTGYYEKVINDYLLNNKHSSLIILKPKEGLNKEREEALRNKLAEYKKTLSKEEIQQIIENKKRLKAYQEAPSTKEELEAIPLLTRDDMDKEAQPLYNEELIVEGVKVIHHNVYTNGIAYLRLFFDVKDTPEELLPYLSLLSLVMGYMDTENYSYNELSNEINIHTGGISTNVMSFSVKGDTHKYIPMFEFSAKVLYDKLPEAFRIIDEIIHRTKLEDIKRIREIVDEMKSRMQMRFNSSGHMVAVDRAASYYSAHGLFKELTTGIAFYKFLEDLSDNFDMMKDTVVEKFKELQQMIFTKENMLISITADEAGIGQFKSAFDGFISLIKTEAGQDLFSKYDRKSLTPQCLNEGFKTALQVQYVARVGNFFEAGYKYSGALRVLKVILSYDYLWNNVRVKGGAYGCMCGFSGVEGDAYFTSYRDPNLKETNQIYEEAAEYVEKFTADERDMTKYIIGTFSSMDAPLTPQAKGRRSLSFYMAGISYEELQKEREEILNVTQEDIQKLSGIVRSITDKGCICVLGSESKIEENKDLFKEVKKLIK